MNRFHKVKLLSVTALGVLALGALASPGLARDHSERHRHHHDNDSTGTIQSFDTETGRLAIGLPSGETVSGLVTRRTRIRCEDEHSPDITRQRRGELEPDDDRGGHGEEEADDDRSGHDEEGAGDDRGGDDNSGPGSSNSGSGPSGHDDNGRGANCTASDLIEGAGVHKAELEVEHGQVTFEEVELAD